MVVVQWNVAVTRHGRKFLPIHFNEENPAASNAVDKTPSQWEFPLKTNP
jgi:hypothetical protein